MARESLQRSEPSTNERMIEAAQGQLNDFAWLAGQISENLLSADAEEEKLNHLEQDGKGIKSLQERIESFFRR